MDKSLAIEVTNVSKVYSLRKRQNDFEGKNTNEHWALNNISFRIKKGESVGIIGPNGSGKSTLLKILAGVTKPSSGEVIIRGKVASILDIGAGFHPELSGRENIFLNGQILGFSKREIQVKYDDIVEFSGIEKFIGEPIKSYSNGMYLRLAFSIMAHLDFDVYLFDEVMSVGDADFSMKAKSKIQELLLTKKTIIFVSHNLSELNSMDLFISLENGVIVGKSYNSDTLSDYYEKSIKGRQQIVNRDTIITDFSKFSESEELKINKVKLFQEGQGEFTTDKVISFTVEFEKLTDTDTILDLAIFISDLQGSLILSTNPLLSGLNSNSEKGVYVYTCNFPAFIFGFQVYSIGLLFTKNMMGAFHELDNMHEISDYKVSNKITNMINSSYRMDSIISFKPKFRMLNGEAAKGTLNIGNGLLPIFDWSTSFDNKSVKPSSH